jgi:hypothetical protein
MFDKKGLKWEFIDFLDIKRKDYYLSERGDVYGILEQGFLPTTLKEDGKLYVELNCDGGSKRDFQVDMLVAKTFIPNNKKKKKEIDHLDGVLLNNHISNLR